MADAVLNSADWNSKCPPGTAVEVTKVDGSTMRAYTTTPTYRVGEHDFVELFGYRGLWLLSWCQPLEAPTACGGSAAELAKPHRPE